MKKIIFILFVLSLKNTIAQKPVVLLSAYKEFELMSPESPYGLSGQLNLGRLYLQAQYQTTSPFIDKFQKLNAHTSFAYRVGIVSKNIENSNRLAFYLGYRDYSGIKNLVTGSGETSEFPKDNSGNTYEVDRVLVDYNYQAFCLGMNILNIVSAEKSFAKKAAVVRPIINMKLELMYATNVSYNKNITYSPYNFYVPRDLEVNSTLKMKKFGMCARFESAPIEYLGFIMEMGVYPGLKQITKDVNDFNLNVKFGVVANLLFAKKND